MAAGQLKIAMLSVHSCPVGQLGGRDTGGMSVYIRELACELGRRGHAVDIYTRTHDPRDNKIIELGGNVRLIHLEMGGVEQIPKLAVYAYLPDFARALDDFRERHSLEYDLIHSHYWLSGWVGGCLQPWWDVPHLIMFHTLGAVKNAIGVGQQEPELRLETETELVKNCHRIIAATEKEKEGLVGYYHASAETISVIPCGVNLDLFQPVPKEMARQQLGLNGGDIILFVGRIDPLKGIDKLLLAMTYLEKRRGVRLVVIGGDDHSRPELEKLQRLGQRLGIQDSITFAGTVRQEELPSFYSAADVCVIPSHYESFGLVALESLACGTPVVATEVGGIPSVVHQGQTGYVVEDNAPLHLANGIARLLSQRDAGTESRDLTRASVSNFSWANIAEAVLEEYRAVLGSYVASAGQSRFS